VVVALDEHEAQLEALRAEAEQHRAAARASYARGLASLMEALDNWTEVAKKQAEQLFLLQHQDKTRYKAELDLIKAHLEAKDQASLTVITKHQAKQLLLFFKRWADGTPYTYEAELDERIMAETELEQELQDIANAEDDAALQAAVDENATKTSAIHAETTEILLMLTGEEHEA